MNSKTERETLAVCMGAICDKTAAGNPVAWFTLHKQGLTRELLKEVSKNDGWLGCKPLFDLAPDYDDPIWKLMVLNDASSSQANSEKTKL